MIQDLPNDRATESARDTFWLIAIFVGGAIVRFLNLGGKSLWFDEAHGYNVAQAGFDAFWNRGIEPVHPPLFFLLLGYWSELGDSEFVLRSSSVILSLLSLYLIYRLFRGLFGQSVAITVLLLFAFNPLIIWYSQELRNYALLLFFAALSTSALVYAVENQKWARKLIWFGIFTLSSAGLAYTHYGAIFFVYFQLVFLFVLIGFKKISFSSLAYWISGIALGVLLYLPWVNSRVGSAFYNRLLEGQRVAFFPILYRPILPSGSSILDLITAGAPFIIGLFIFAPILAYFICRNQRFQNWLAHIANQGWFRWLVATAFLLVLLIFIIPRGFSVKRHLVVFIPFFLIPIGLLWPFKQNNFRFLVVFASVSLIGSFYNIYFVPKTEWGEMHELIGDRYLPGDAIVLNPRYLVHPSSFYSAEDVRYLNLNLTDLEVILTDDDVDGYERIWYIEQPGSTDLIESLNKTVFEEFRLIESFEYTRTDVYLLE